MTLKAQLLLVAQAYAAASHLSESRISTVVFNDGKVLARLRSGADVTTARYEKAMCWFSANWPDGHNWPVQVTRPMLAAPPMLKKSPS